MLEAKAKDNGGESGKGNSKGLGILEEVEKRGAFGGNGNGGFECPMTGQKFDGEMGGAGGMGPMRPGLGPPRWVRGVLRGVDEGRMQPRDFWLNGLGDWRIGENVEKDMEIDDTPRASTYPMGEMC
jgi:hypothetical protein